MLQISLFHLFEDNNKNDDDNDDDGDADDEISTKYRAPGQVPAYSTLCVYLHEILRYDFNPLVNLVRLMI